jgi:hypothetical protein
VVEATVVDDVALAIDVGINAYRRESRSTRLTSDQKF